jgi:hypothetical protein
MKSALKEWQLVIAIVGLGACIVTWYAVGRALAQLV